jgi:hypothetical protein
MLPHTRSSRNRTCLVRDFLGLLVCTSVNYFLGGVTCRSFVRKLELSMSGLTILVTFGFVQVPVTLLTCWIVLLWASAEMLPACREILFSPMVGSLFTSLLYQGYFGWLRCCCQSGAKAILVLNKMEPLLRSGIRQMKRWKWYCTNLVNTQIELWKILPNQE